MATRTNLIRNPSFETSTTDWLASPAVGDQTFTMTRVLQSSTLGARWGRYCLRGTTTAAGTHSWSSSYYVPVTAGTTYAASLYARSSTASRNGGIWIWWFNSSQVYISGTNITSSSLSTTSWTRLQQTATAPTGAAYALIVSNYTSAAGSGEFLYIDGVMFEQSSSVGSYFDGASWDAAGGQQVTSWTSTAHASTSTSTDYARVNLCRNPSFETGTTGPNLNLTRPSYSQSTAAGAYSGTYALSITHTPTVDGLWFGTTSDIVPNPSGTYVISVYARVSSGTASCKPGIGFSTDAVGANIAWSSFNTIIGTSWTRMSFSQTFFGDGYDSGGTLYWPNYFTFFLACPGLSSNQVVYWDGIQIEQASTPSDYFDGSLLDAGNSNYAWSGTVHASLSTDAQVTEIRRNNLITNPSFETGTSPWVGSNFTGGAFTVSRTTSQSLYGSYSMTGTTTYAGWSSLTYGSGTSTWMRVTPGKNYTFSCYLRPSINGRQGYIQIQYMDSAGAEISNANGGLSEQLTSGLSDSSWTRVSTSIVAPMNAQYARLGISQTVASAAGEVMHIDGVQFEESSSVTEYLDGSLPAGAWGYSWLGTAHASVSTAIELMDGSAVGTYDFSGVAVGEFPLAAPASLVATAQPSGTQINLTWGTVNGALWYDIERDNVIVARWITTNSYNDTGLTPNTSYTYRVRAVRNHAT